VVWDHAWYETEVRREILRLAYNPDNCCNSTWQDYINETRAKDEKYIVAIKELCERYCLKDDAERLEAKRIHVAKLGIPVSLASMYTWVQAYIFIIRRQRQSLELDPYFALIEHAVLR